MGKIKYPKRFKYLKKKKSRHVYAVVRYNKGSVMTVYLYNEEWLAKRHCNGCLPAKVEEIEGVTCLQDIADALRIEKGLIYQKMGHAPHVWTEKTWQNYN